MIEYDPAFEARVVELGREGRDRPQIASQLGVSLERLASWARQHPQFDEALRRADTEALAWWSNLARDAVMKDGVFHPAVWEKAMAQRLRSSAPRKPASELAPKPAPTVIFNIPDNGRERRRRVPG